MRPMTEDEWYQDLTDTGYTKHTLQEEIIWKEAYIQNYYHHYDPSEDEVRLAALKRLVGEMDDG